METTENTTMALARAIQQSMLKQSVPQCTCGSIHLENRMLEDVGGDFYYFQNHGPEQVAFAIGDVMGHGISAALVMTQIMGLIQADKGNRTRPAQMAQTINQSLIDLGQRLDTPMTCSVLYGLVDLPSGVLLYVNAGHPRPVIHNHSSGLTHLLGPTTALLGVHDHTPGESCHQFARGDRVVLYTDGITEARNQADELFGDERLKTVVHDHAKKDAATLAAELFGACDAFTGNVPTGQDDMTLMIIDFEQAGQ